MGFNRLALGSSSGHEEVEALSSKAGSSISSKSLSSSSSVSSETADMPRRSTISSFDKSTGWMLFGSLSSIVIERRTSERSGLEAHMFVTPEDSLTMIPEACSRYRKV